MFRAVPQPGYLIVEPMPSEDFNKTELVILADEREHVSTGKVLAVSEYAGTYENFSHQVSTDITAGDVIAYIKYSEQPIKLNGVELHQVRFDKVVSKIEEAK